MLRTPVRRPAYGGYGRVGGGGCRCGGTALLAAVLALLAAVLAVNYVLLERRKCATQLQDLEDDLDEKESIIQKLRQQLGDLRHGLPPVSAPAAAGKAAAAGGSGKGLQDAWRDDGGAAAQQPRLRQQQPPAQQQQQQQPPPPPPPAAPPGGVEPAPKDTRQARALLVICYNRPDYLRRTLNAVLTRLPAYNRPHVYISQDGDEAPVSAVVGEFAARFAAEAPDVPFTHWRHPPVAPEALARAASWATGYYKLAQHFGWALNKIFGAPLAHPRVIILEDDLEVAVDFFDYFTAVEPLLDNDASLLAASAWNDVGQAAYVSDPTAVHRSDFFPGLGWMINAHHWEELGPKWPDSFWDDWLREPPQRRGRAVLHPQVSRSYTFGEEGVSRAQFFAQYLGNIKLNDVPVDWASLDLSYLDRPTYDAALAADVARARLVGVEEAVTAVCPPGAGGGKDAPLPAVKTTYAGFEGPAGYEGVAQRFGFINDVKAGVPRTAYLGGVVAIRHNGCLKLLVPADWKAPHS